MISLRLKAGYFHGFQRLLNCDALEIEVVLEMGTELVGSARTREDKEPEVGSAGGIGD